MKFKKFAIPDGHLITAKHQDVISPRSVQIFIRKGTLDKTAQFDFKSILQKYYPELLKDTRRMKQTELDLLDQYGFSKYSWTKMINNKRTILFLDIYIFAQMLQDRCKIILTPVIEDIPA